MTDSSFRFRLATFKIFLDLVAALRLLVWTQVFNLFRNLLFVLFLRFLLLLALAQIIPKYSQYLLLRTFLFFDSTSLMLLRLTFSDLVSTFFFGFSAPSSYDAFDLFLISYLSHFGPSLGASVRSSPSILSADRPFSLNTDIL